MPRDSLVHGSMNTSSHVEHRCFVCVHFGSIHRLDRFHRRGTRVVDNHPVDWDSCWSLSSSFSSSSSSNVSLPEGDRRRFPTRCWSQESAVRHDGTKKNQETSSVGERISEHAALCSNYANSTDRTILNDSHGLKQRRSTSTYAYLEDYWSTHPSARKRRILRDDWQDRYLNEHSNCTNDDFSPEFRHTYLDGLYWRWRKNSHWISLFSMNSKEIESSKISLHRKYLRRGSIRSNEEAACSRDRAFAREICPHD